MPKKALGVLSNPRKWAIPNTKKTTKDKRPKGLCNALNFVDRACNVLFFWLCHRDVTPRDVWGWCMSHTLQVIVKAIAASRNSRNLFRTYTNNNCHNVSANSANILASHSYSIPGINVILRTRNQHDCCMSTLCLLEAAFFWWSERSQWRKPHLSHDH